MFLNYEYTTGVMFVWKYVGGCVRFLHILQIIPIFPSVGINVTGF